MLNMAAKISGSATALIAFGAQREQTTLLCQIRVCKDMLASPDPTTVATKDGTRAQLHLRWSQRQPRCPVASDATAHVRCFTSGLKPCFRGLKFLFFVGGAEGHHHQKVFPFQ